MQGAVVHPFSAQDVTVGGEINVLRATQEDANADAAHECAGQREQRQATVWNTQRGIVQRHHKSGRKVIRGADDGLRS